MCQLGTGITKNTETTFELVHPCYKIGNLEPRDRKTANSIEISFSDRDMTSKLISLFPEIMPGFC